MEHFNVLDLKKSFEESSLKFSLNLILRLISSLQTKSFVLLTGLSGSGKTKLAQMFSMFMSEENSKGNDEIHLDLSVNKSAIENLGWTLPVEIKDRIGCWDKKRVGVTINGRTLNGYIDNYPRLFYQKDYHLGDVFNVGDTVDVVIDLGGVLKVPNDNNQYKLIAVGADWTSNENLLGYPDALNPGVYRKPDNGALDLILRAKNDPDYPYFLILDEMNLSHVERYFADFLSAMESEEAISLHDDTGEDWPAEPGGEQCVPAKLKIPKNLFVIGTVNVDETTYMFSPKVLDRANVIEFRVSDEEMGAFLENPGKPNLDAIAGKGAKFAKDFVREAKQRNVPLDEALRIQVSVVLMKFFPELQNVGAEFGYRSANEICRFIYFYNTLAVAFNFDIAMDAAIMQKLLPKLHGSKKKLGPVIEALIELCASDTTLTEGKEDKGK